MSTSPFRRVALQVQHVGHTSISRSFGVHSWRRGPSGYMGSGAPTAEGDISQPKVLVTGSCGQIGMNNTFPRFYCSHCPSLNVLLNLRNGIDPKNA
jgi:hypothetical protein